MYRYSNNRRRKTQKPKDTTYRVLKSAGLKEERMDGELVREKKPQVGTELKGNIGKF